MSSTLKGKSLSTKSRSAAGLKSLPNLLSSFFLSLERLVSAVPHVTHEPCKGGVQSSGPIAQEPLPALGIEDEVKGHRMPAATAALVTPPPVQGLGDTHAAAAGHQNPLGIFRDDTWRVP
eukprot:scaffold1237_cov243-Pinguiococcus_pyrenoidosus.AAC.32